jgi:hypothetical protein
MQWGSPPWYVVQKKSPHVHLPGECSPRWVPMRAASGLFDSLHTAAAIGGSGANIGRRAVIGTARRINFPRHIYGTLDFSCATTPTRVTAHPHIFTPKTAGRNFRNYFRARRYTREANPWMCRAEHTPYMDAAHRHGAYFPTSAVRCAVNDSTPRCPGVLLLWGPESYSIASLRWRSH